MSYIGNDAFYNCFNFKKVTIYDIAAWCKIDFESSRNSNPLDYAKYFYLNDERVYDLIIPNGVTKIQGAFRSCTDFTSIKVCCNRPPVISSTEFSVSKEIPLYVPKGTAMMYMSATGWNEFTNIVEFEDGGDAHYITIRMGNGGALKQSVEIGKTYLYVVQPDEGWSVSTVTFNGTNMTSMLIDGQFSTPVIIGNSELNVVFKQNASSAKAMQIESNVKVSAYNGTIRITGAENSAVVNVYNTSGMLVGSSFGNATFTLDSGIYIVKVRDETFKLNL